ncbi:MarR family winged helix-turn-helix transcriptional regulator [Brevibacterium litoralis]|uniref:MarR family winged helix-turn-helix transcriptional regulator n=1 Tax=Brevibacterium litoralis TaxID=3138935 RepID=UPI0032EBABDB
MTVHHENDPMSTSGEDFAEIPTDGAAGDRTGPEVPADEVRWLSSEERRTWLAILSFAETVPAAIERRLKKEFDLTRYEYNVLAMLSEHREGLRPMTDLAMVTHGSLSRLSHTVAKLEKRGQVRKFPKPEDKRTSLVELTQAGRELVERAAPVHVEDVRRIVFDKLPTDRVGILADLLDAVTGRSPVDPKEV